MPLITLPTTKEDLWRSMHFSKIEEYLGKNGACVSVFIVIFKLQQRELTLWDCFKYASVAMAMMEG